MLKYNLYFYLMLAVGFTFLLSGILQSYSDDQELPRILVFSKTEGFRHIQAIEAANVAFKEMGEQYGFNVDITEDASKFNDDTLKNYHAVVFSNVSGEVFNDEQKRSFKRFIQAGGGFVGIHGATDAERDWPWYGRLIGAYFESHPRVQKGKFFIVDSTHAATQSLPEEWWRTDEFYNFQKVYSGINPLVTIDETSYEGGNMGEEHPMVWYHKYDGGRSFYTAMGHTPETFSEPLIRELLWGGLFYVLGGDDPEGLDYSQVIPESNRFTKHILLEQLNEPIHMDFASNGTVYFVERRGDVKVYDPTTKEEVIIGSIPVYTQYEDGLLGIALDPDFDENQWIYLYYTSADGKEFRLSRITVEDNERLNSNSEKILLNIPKEILDGSHTGGGLTFDEKTGDLYITVGDNTSPRATRYAPLDEREGRKEFNAQRSAGNTNDLRGGILRIHPEDDGTYSIPECNLFAPDTPNTRPEIYVMGSRQPWRIHVDSKTGWLYSGDVGPDSHVDSLGLGPMGFDKFHQTREPSNHGWPYFTGNNQAYWNYDFETSESGQQFNPDRLINNSRYNTGLEVLPSPDPPLIWYPYAESEKFFLLGSGSRSAVGGPVFRKEDFDKNVEGVFPPYYEGKWFITDWIRGWINVVTLDEEGSYKWMETFMESDHFTSPIDMQFGPDGSLYVLDYGSGWFQPNNDAKLVRIDFNAGNRKPVVNISADKQRGAIPLIVTLSSDGTFDYDGDKLTYSWHIISSDGEVLEKIHEPHPTVKFDEAGIYQVELTVSDEDGAENSKSLEIKAGNEPPIVNINIVRGNRTFFPPDKSIEYKIIVKDKEDGSLTDDGISSSDVNVSFDYWPDGYNEDISSNGSESPTNNVGIQMKINNLFCYSCHARFEESVGPSFEQISRRYQMDEQTISQLADNIIHGSQGVWSDVAMSAHPSLSEEEAKQIVQYILSLDNEEPKHPDKKSLDAEGRLTPTLPDEFNTGGVYVLRASYTDQGANGIPNITTTHDVALKYPVLTPEDADVKEGFMRVVYPDSDRRTYMLYGPHSYLGYQNIDITDIDKIIINALPSMGGIIEVRVDSSTGRLIGQTEPLVLPETGEEMPSTYSIKVKGMGFEGKHDLYFVSKNNIAEGHDILFRIRSFGFSFSHDN